jgi:hypothetical protein
MIVLNVAAFGPEPSFSKLRAAIRRLGELMKKRQSAT